MNKGVVIQASSRSVGNTSALVRQFNTTANFDVVDLNTKQIQHFDYAFKNRNDDFNALFKTIVKKYKTLVFATPVYWYTMSGLLKVFLDRISDVLINEKDVGRQLRGKSMAVLSTNLEDAIHGSFSDPFEKSAAYLGMHFIGHQHVKVTNGRLTEQAINKTNAFAVHCMQTLENNK